MSEGIKAFGAMLDGQGNGCITVGHALCARLGVPYLQERESERLLGHRRTKTLRGGFRKGAMASMDELEGELLAEREFRFPNGELLRTNEWPKRLFEEKAEQLSEEVWTKENWPDSFNDAKEAVAKLPNGITGVYYHRPSMNLVLVGPTGEKVGVRSTAIMTPMIGIDRDHVFALGALKKASAA